MSVIKQQQRKIIVFLGSMQLAVVLLTILAIASVIGTVLQQNESYQNYIIKFGPFWFEIFEKLGLYDVYSTLWFLSILGFLILSVSICIYRNVPVVIKDIKHYRLNTTTSSLHAFHLKKQWIREADQQHEVIGQALLKSFGYQTKLKQHDDHVVIAAKKGNWGRLGYIFTHTAIVLICLGAMIDANVFLKYANLTGKVKPEIRDVSVSQVPEISRVSADNMAFRGSVTIPEGGYANVVFLQLRDGFLVQELPFSIGVKDFRMSHYSTGQPKSYESDLVIIDKTTEKPIHTTIAVNHPWIYKDYAIYQSSFEDGGSELELKIWGLDSMNHPDNKPIKAIVGKKYGIGSQDQKYAVEITGFRLFNINTVMKPSGKRETKNFGPSFQYKLRFATGEALEFDNYMNPIKRDGHDFFISGVRKSVAEPFQFLYLPADNKMSIQRFLDFHSLVFDDQKIEQVAEMLAKESFKEKPNSQVLEQRLKQMIQAQIRNFREGGPVKMLAGIDRKMPKEKRMQVEMLHFKILHQTLSLLYAKAIQADIAAEQDKSEQTLQFDTDFYENSVNVLGAMYVYGSPYFLQMTSFVHKQASGLQITRAPGKSVLYFGCAVLVIGIFLMLYVPYRRVWFWISDHENGNEILLAGSGARNTYDFKREFKQICEKYDQLYQRR